MIYDCVSIILLKSDWSVPVAAFFKVVWASLPHKHLAIYLISGIFSG